MHNPLALSTIHYHLYSDSKRSVILISNAFAIFSNCNIVGMVLPFSILFNVLLLISVRFANSIRLTFFLIRACQVNISTLVSLLSRHKDTRYSYYCLVVIFSINMYKFFYFLFCYVYSFV